MTKNVYIAMKFNRDKSKSTLAEQLAGDLRTCLLGDKNLIVTPTYPKVPGTDYTYIGPFYCESAGDGASVTCTECRDIVKAELGALDNCDLFVCYLDDHMSVGSIAELMYCAMKQIPSIIFYQTSDTKYEIKSKSWFAITAAQQINTNTRLYPVQDLSVELLREVICDYIAEEEGIVC